MKNSNTIIISPSMFLLFLTLKLTGYIDWSWWWVTAPLWGGFALIIILWIILLIVYEVTK